jgi:uncharacterized protein YndB with AHSA1/START domain
VPASPRPSVADEPQERVLVITRVFDAPRSLLFKLWTDPAHAKHWMGPRGFSAVHFEQDPRPGGTWRGCLRPDNGGRDLWQGGVYREIVEPERLVFSFAWDGEDGLPGRETLVTVTFAEHQGKTTLTLRQAVFATVEQRNGHQGGWTSSFDRLEEHVARLRHG